MVEKLVHRVSFIFRVCACVFVGMEDRAIRARNMTLNMKRARSQHGYYTWVNRYKVHDVYKY